MTKIDPGTDNVVIKATDVNKAVSLASQNIQILQDISLDVVSGSTVSISGASGSGKTTLLGLLAGLDLPTSGSISLLEQSLQGMDEDQRADLRCGRVGFVFQSFHLLPNLTAVENVALALEVIPGSKDISGRSMAALSRVGLEGRAQHLPSQMSGGEQQRVAIARALVTNPGVLFADEPTGALDSTTSDEVLALLEDIVQEGKTLVLVTHDPDVAKRMQRTIRLHDGRIVSDRKRS